MRDLRGQIALDPLAQLPGLNTIELSAVDRKVRWDLAKELPGLTRLALSGRYVADRDLLKLRFCPAIEDLELDKLPAELAPWSGDLH